MMTLNLADLNESQAAATRWEEGPLLVLAGPGSGKTRVLTYRVARLIDGTPDSQFRVLAVTFTNKAASEMRSRIDSLLSHGRQRVKITTFHALAADTLRQHGSHIGIRPDFMILSEAADREAVLSEAIQAAIQDDDEFQPRAPQLMPVIDRLLDECVSSDQAEGALEGTPHATELAAVYREYMTALVRGNHLDFGSLIAFAVRLLEEKPAVARQIQRVYSYVCVDEFQDTNASQFKFLVQLVPEERANLFVVADDDQMIYQWNGASPARLKELRTRFDMPVVQLPENFRCPPEVISLANRLIQHNDDRSADKVPLVSHKARGEGRVVTKRFEDFDAELRWLADRLKRFTSAERSNCVVLARRKKLLESAVDVLNAQGVPAHLAVRKNEFQSAPFRWLHGMLRLANARHDRGQLRRVSRAFAQLEGISIEVDDVVAQAAVDSTDFLRTWVQLARGRRSLESQTALLLDMTESTLVDRLDYWDFVEAGFQWFSEVETRPRDPEETAFDEYADELGAWHALVAEIGGHYDRKELSLHKFLQELDLRAKEVPPPTNAVRCLTIHGSKGTEFRHVFLIGLVEDELPSWASKKKGDSSDELREERRECFVAITRAEETLTMTFAQEYFGWSKEPSRFLFEMGALRSSP